MKARIAIVCSIAALTLSLAHATTIIPVSVEELTHGASNVVRARAVTSWSDWDAQHAAIYTFTRFEVLSQLKGSAPLTLTVKQPGGDRDGVTMKAAGVRQFAPNEEDVLFLRPSIAGDGSMVVVGLVQGRFQVVRSAGTATVSNGVTGVMSFNPAQHAVSVYQGGRMTLQQLEARVRKAVAQ